MVIIHIAHIDTSIIGGVQMAVPQMVMAQSHFADVALLNTFGDPIQGVRMLPYNGQFDAKLYPAPFHKPDIVIFHEVYRFEFIKLYQMVKANAIPYVVIPHGCLTENAQRRKFLKKATANLIFFNRFLREATAIQFLSENERQMSGKWGKAAFVAGNGIAMPEKRKSVFFAEGIRIAYIGRLEIRTKGLDLLVEAVENCQDMMRKHKVRVDIYGPNDGDVHAVLRQMIERKQLSDLIAVSGAKMGKEKEAILLSSDCFIQPSRTEGLPMGPLEALAYGLPCIVTAGTGLGALVEKYHAGYSCDTSSDGISGAIVKLIQERGKAEELSLGAVKLIESNFDRETIGKATVGKYGQIAKS